jgi:DNA-binding transcriptional regulator YiaG
MKKIELDLKIDAAVNDLSEKLKALPRVKDGKIYRVPPAMQAKTVKILRSSGIKIAELAQRLGISANTIRIWDHRRKNPKKTKKVKFTQVKVRPEKVALPERQALTLELASGARVHGLSMKEIRELVTMDGGMR